MTFNSLPVELQLNIFSYLSRNELSRVVPSVCKAWAILAFDSSLWPNITIDFSKLGTNSTMQKLLPIVPKARELELIEFRSGNLDPFVSKYNFSCSLRRLTLLTCTITKNALSQFATQCPFLEDLRISTCRIRDGVIEEISQWKKLTGVKFKGCRNIQTKTWLHRITSACPKLESFALSYTHHYSSVDKNEMSTEMFVSLFGQLSCTNIRLLSLQYENLVDKELEVIFAKCPLLEKLDCTGNHFLTDRSVSAIVSNCGQLQSLTLTHNQNITVNSILRVPLPFPNLRHLDLLQCYSVNFDNVREILKHHPNLEIINSDGKPMRTNMLAFKTIFGDDFVNNKLKKLTSDQLDILHRIF